MKTIRTEIKDLVSAFETKTRDNGQEFVALKRSKYETYKNMVRNMHGTEMLPDDFRYQTIEGVLRSMLDVADFDNVEDSDSLRDALEDKRHEIVDSLVDFYNKDLTRWIDSNLMRASYVDEAQNEYGPSGELFKSLQMGQFQEIDEIYSNIVSELVDLYENEIAA